jgi:vacuolar protein sorting-associated protein 13A/C
LKQDENVIITTSDLEYRDTSICLIDSQGRELYLKLNYNDSTQSGRMVSVFCPYLVLNRSGIDLYFSSKSLVTNNRLTAGQEKQNHGLLNVEPILFSYSSHEPGKSKGNLGINKRI